MQPISIKRFQSKTAALGRYSSMDKIDPATLASGFTPSERVRQYHLPAARKQDIRDPDLSRRY
jgi:hypothetical protein